MLYYYISYYSAVTDTKTSSIIELLLSLLYPIFFESTPKLAPKNRTTPSRRTLLRSLSQMLVITIELDLFNFSPFLKGDSLEGRTRNYVIYIWEKDK